MPENAKDQTPTTPEAIVSQCTTTPATYHESRGRKIIYYSTTEAADTSSQISREPIHHDLNDFGDKIKRILPPVHPAGNVFFHITYLFLFCSVIALCIFRAL